jgi:DNA-binding CsgD family transcriptional regulator
VKPLTAMELFVVQRMALGDSCQQVGHKLGVPGTPEQQRSRAKEACARVNHKLGARNITHAAVIALDAGLIHPEECGTERTYRWHLRHGQVPDTLCRGALAAVRREQRQGATA